MNKENTIKVFEKDKFALMGTRKKNFDTNETGIEKLRGS